MEYPGGSGPLRIASLPTTPFLGHFGFFAGHCCVSSHGMTSPRHDDIMTSSLRLLNASDLAKLRSLHAPVTKTLSRTFQ